MNFPDFSLDISLPETAKEPDQGVTYDLLILGGGPAAMSAAVYAARKMMNVVIITKDLGGQIHETSEVENWLGFQSISSRELVGMFEEHVKSFDIAIRIGSTVNNVVADEAGFMVYTSDDKMYSGRTVIVATGKHHRPIGVPGEKELVGRGVAYCATCDAPFFKGKKVVVAGGGNSAFTTAIDLLKAEAEVTIINFTKGWQADEVLRERVGRSEKATLLDYHQIFGIEGTDKVTGVIIKNRNDDKEERLNTSGVFIEIGLLPNNEAVKDLVRLNDQGEIIIDCSCRTSVPGVFGAGDVTTVPHKQIVIAASEGAKAALSAYDYLINKSLI